MPVVFVVAPTCIMVDNKKEIGIGWPRFSGCGASEICFISQFGQVANSIQVLKSATEKVLETVKKNKTRNKGNFIRATRQSGFNPTSADSRRDRYKLQINHFPTSQ